jgi:hypothetical protein
MSLPKRLEPRPGSGLVKDKEYLMSDCGARPTLRSAIAISPVRLTLEAARKANMRPTKSVDNWFMSDGPETEDEKRDLLNSLLGVAEYINYATEVQYLVTGPTGKVLKLANKEEYKLFIKFISELEVDDEPLEDEPAGA